VVTVCTTIFQIQNPTFCLRNVYIVLCNSQQKDKLFFNVAFNDWLAFNPVTAYVPCAVWTVCLVLFSLNCVFTRYTIILFHLPILVIILQFSYIVNLVFIITLATYFLMILKNVTSSCTTIISILKLDAIEGFLNCTCSKISVIDDFICELM
jgi:hypothetical protein